MVNQEKKKRLAREREAASALLRDGAEGKTTLQAEQPGAAQYPGKQPLKALSL